MATPERETVYRDDDPNHAVSRRTSNGTGWFIGIIVVLALLAIGYLVYSASSGPALNPDAVTTPGVEAPATTPAPITEAPPLTDNTAPAVEPPATAPSTPMESAPPATPTPATPAPEQTPATPAAPAAPAV